MGIKQLEAAVLNELREVTGNKKLRQKDILEWSTGDVKAQDGELLARLPSLKVNVAYKAPTAARGRRAQDQEPQ